MDQRQFRPPGQVFSEISKPKGVGAFQNLQEDARQLGELESLLSTVKPRVILAPPRTSSTALAIALSKSPAVGPGYVHEPCDRFAHEGAGISTITDAIGENARVAGSARTGILVKEMTFQMGVGPVFEAFMQNHTGPVIVLLRNPVLSIESRIRKVCEDQLKGGGLGGADRDRLGGAVRRQDYSGVGDLLSDDVFPLRFIGWDFLAAQMEYIKARQIPYILIDSTDFRRNPKALLEGVCERVGVGFVPEMVDWGRGGGERFGKLAEQGRWYSRVAGSSGVLPPTEKPIPLSAFPERFREPVRKATEIYESLLQDGGFLRV